jgi:hypothetical protein
MHQEKEQVMTHRNAQQGSVQEATRRGVISGLGRGTRRSLLSVIGAAWLFAAGIAPTEAAIKIETAEVQNGVMFIMGNGAVLGAQITWEGGAVTHGEDQERRLFVSARCR